MASRIALGKSESAGGNVPGRRLSVARRKCNGSVCCGVPRPLWSCLALRERRLNDGLAFLLWEDKPLAQTRRLDGSAVGAAASADAAATLHTAASSISIIILIPCKRTA